MFLFLLNFTVFKLGTNDEVDQLTEDVSYENSYTTSLLFILVLEAGEQGSCISCLRMDDQIYLNL